MKLISTGVTDILTIADLRKEIKKANLILAKIRFGNLERVAALTKPEALLFIFGLEDHLTPSDLEMYTNRFGYVEISPSDRLGKRTRTVHLG